jgi:hypothetical protein
VLRSQAARLIVAVLLLACAQSHEPAGARSDAGHSEEAGVGDAADVGSCTSDSPPIVIGSCFSATFLENCRPWVERRSPPGAAGVVACRGGGYPCARASECDPDPGGDCRCGTVPECAPGQVCVRTGWPASGPTYECMCGVGPP